MKKLILKRPEESFNQYCSYSIMVDGKKLTELKNGEEKIIEISPDLIDKPLKAKIQWCSSKEYPLSQFNDLKKIEVTGNKFLNRRIPLVGALFPLVGIVIFNGEYTAGLRNLGIGILLILIVGLIGTITIWKDKWLKLTVD